MKFPMIAIVAAIGAGAACTTDSLTPVLTVPHEPVFSTVSTPDIDFHVNGTTFDGSSRAHNSCTNHTLYAWDWIVYPGIEDNDPTPVDSVKVERHKTSYKNCVYEQLVGGVVDVEATVSGETQLLTRFESDVEYADNLAVTVPTGESITVTLQAYTNPGCSFKYFTAGGYQISGNPASYTFSHDESGIIFRAIFQC